MTRNIRWFLRCILLCSVALLLNTILYFIHTHSIEQKINMIKTKLVEHDVTLHYDDMQFNGFKSWDIYGIINGFELRTGASQVALRISIPKVEITSSMEIDWHMKMLIQIPQVIDGRISVGPMIAQALQMQRKYDIRLRNSRDILFDAQLCDFLLDKCVMNVVSHLHDVVLETANNNPMTLCVFKTIDLDVTTVQRSHYPYHQEKHMVSQYLVKIHDMDVNLSEDMLNKIFPKHSNTSDINNAFKNIDMVFELSKSISWIYDEEAPPIATWNERMDKGLFRHHYNGNFMVFSKVFDFVVDGKHNKSYYKDKLYDIHKKKSVMNFKIRNFNGFCEYMTAIATSFANMQDTPVSKDEMEKIVGMIKAVLFENAKHIDDETIGFTISDGKEGILLSDKTAALAFAPVVQEIEKINPSHS